MDILKRVEELQDLFDEDEVTTADKINRPEPKQSVKEIELFNEFNIRNPKAGGGMLVQPSADGSRPGYAKKKDNSDTANIKRKQDSINSYIEEFGEETLNKISKKKYKKKFKNLGKDDLSNLKRRVTKFKNFIVENGRMPTETEAREIGRTPRTLKEADIQIKLLNATNEKKFFDPKKFAKNNNISMNELKRQANLLQTNIYTKRTILSGKKNISAKLRWIPDDASISDNALNKLWKSKLIKYERNKIDEIFYDAFGREFTKGTKNKNPNYNPKKYLAIKKNLNEYRQLKKAINERFPGINFELDHPLSKSSLNKLFNATTDQLTRVNVLDADLNNGFKDTLSLQYEKAVQGNDLKKKKAVEKIARDLKLNIGKISDDATNFKYGVKEFQKLNIKNEIGKSLENLSALNKNFKSYAKNNPKLFEAAGVNTQQTFTKVNNVKGLVPFMKKLGIKCQLSEGINCMNPKAYEKSLNQISKAAQAGDSAAQSKLLNFRKAVRGAGGVIKGVLGPAAIAAEIGIAIPIGLFDYAQGKPTEEIVNTLTYGLGGKSRQDRLKEQMPTYGQGDKLQTAFDTYLSTLNKQGLPRDPNELRPGIKTSQAINRFNKARQPFIRPNPQVEEGGFFDLDMFNRNVSESRALEQKLAEEDLKRQEQRKTPFDLSDPFMAADGGLSGGDKSGPPPESGPTPHGLPGILKRVKNI
jgi:hypothetical protein